MNSKKLRFLAKLTTSTLATTAVCCIDANISAMENDNELEDKIDALITNFQDHYINCRRRYTVHGDMVILYSKYINQQIAYSMAEAVQLQLPLWQLINNLKAMRDNEARANHLDLVSITNKVIAKLEKIDINSNVADCIALLMSDFKQHFATRKTQNWCHEKLRDHYLKYISYGANAALANFITCPAQSVNILIGNLEDSKQQAFNDRNLTEGSKIAMLIGELKDNFKI